MEADDSERQAFEEGTESGAGPSLVASREQLRIARQVEHLYASVIDFARRLVGENDMENFVYEAINKAWEHGKLFDQGVEAYLRKTIKNQVLDEVRRVKRWRPVKISDAHLGEKREVASDRHVSDEEVRMILHAAIQQLSAAERDVMLLVLSDDQMSSEQMGEQLGITAGAFRQRRSSAIGKLGRILGQMGFSASDFFGSDE